MLKKKCMRVSLIFLNSLIKAVLKFHSFLLAYTKEKDIEDENYKILLTFYHIHTTYTFFSLKF